jgi:calmodulin
MMYSFEDKFTDIELEKFKEAFIFFDRNGDGTLKNEDLGLALRSMGALVSNKEVQTLLRKYDPDNIGTIDLNDFIACMAEIVNKPDNESEIRGGFSVFDKDDNGLLPVDEMRHVLTRIGDPMSQEEITNFLNILVLIFILQLIY